MRTHAQAVVIGGGVIGCSILYHLAKLARGGQYSWPARFNQYQPPATLHDDTLQGA